MASPKIPDALTKPENLAYLAVLLAWKEGDPTPQPPNTLGMPLPDFMALLDVPANREYVVRRLSFFVRAKARG